MIRRFEIRNRMGQGDVQAVVTIETDVLLTNNAELDLVLIDVTTLPPSVVLGLQMGPGFGHRETVVAPAIFTLDGKKYVANSFGELVPAAEVKDRPAPPAPPEGARQLSVPVVTAAPGWVSDAMQKSTGVDAAGVTAAPVAPPAPAAPPPVPRAVEMVRDTHDPKPLSECSEAEQQAYAAVINSPR